MKKGKRRYKLPSLDAFMGHVWAGKNGCAEWQGRTFQGYGQLGSLFAHRIAWELFVSEIPAGFQIDHLCRNRCCVQATHLELVTLLENVRRGVVSRGLEARREKRGNGNAAA